MKNNQISTRELLEQAMEKAKLQELSSSENLAPSENEETSEETPSQEIPSTEEVSIKAPRSFNKEFAEKFAELPADWQAYLCQFEEDALTACNKSKEETAWLMDLFLLRDPSLRAHNEETPREWVEKMAFIEHMPSSRPSQMLRDLAKLYLEPNTQVCCTPSPITVYYKQRCQERAKNWIERRLSEKDANGCECFPHHKGVQDLIIKLLSAKLVPDITQAYGVAVWMDEKTRVKMIEEAVSQKIREKAQEAQEAKEKAFLKNSKSDTIVLNEKPKTTRQLLEEAFKKYASQN